MQDLLESIGAGIVVFLIFLGMATPVLVIGLFYYLKKRLEHKQIMAAIEKGLPFSNIKPPRHISPDWIKNFTAGIAMLIIAATFAYFMYIVRRYEYDHSVGHFLIVVILFAFGIARTIRGLLQRNAEKKIPTPTPANSDSINSELPS